MSRLKPGEPFIHPGCQIVEARFGRHVEIGRAHRRGFCGCGNPVRSRTG